MNILIYCLIKIQNTLESDSITLSIIQDNKYTIWVLYFLSIFFFLMLLLHKMNVLLYIKKSCFFIHGACQLFILNINLLEWEICNLQSILVTYELIANVKLYVIVV